ncbi:MAG: Slp family lipoprotein [Desulfurella sp.]|uniref:Slp family lipoprotein n=1 Tax=Desulfurella sp. TaxID=1962857 RepID=UPI003C805403
MLYSCVTPAPISGHFVNIAPTQAQESEVVGKVVRFGGSIISTVPQQNGTTCFVVLGLKLNSWGEPYSVKPENFVGRFIACAKGYYDPEIYQKNRKVTFVGKIVGTKKEKVGDFTYNYPLIDVKSLYLWSKQEENNVRFSPCWGSYSLLPCR